VRDEGDFADSISSLLRMDLIRAAEDSRGEILFFEPGRRRALDIYRNTILHFLAPPGFLARELLASGARERVKARVGEWLEIFYGEFFIARDVELADHLEAFLVHFEQRGWIASVDGGLRATSEGVPHLEFLSEQMCAVVESYYVAVFAVAELVEPIPRKALHKRIAEQFERLALIGEVGLPEAQNPVTFANAVEGMIRRRILVVSPGGEGDRGDAPLARGPRWDELAALRTRLAAALGTR